MESKSEWNVNLITQHVFIGLGSAGATAASEKMTKVHQDDDYIYPSLDLSDDEMEIAPTSLQVFYDHKYQSQRDSIKIILKYFCFVEF